jgi:uncharacterized protein YcfJ
MRLFASATVTGLVGRQVGHAAVDRGRKVCSAARRLVGRHECGQVPDSIEVVDEASALMRKSCSPVATCSFRKRATPAHEKTRVHAMWPVL